MPTTFANTIDSNPIYAKRAEEDQNGLNIDQTYAKKSELPTVNDGTLTIQKNGTTVDTFTANSSSNKTVNIEVPTKTSDLTNDSGFITASDIPAQVQSNWNETDNTDPSYIQNKPSIPAAQVNSDWNASSGVAEILNKPSIPTATSDLNNDSGFITASDVPAAQEQADWNESNSSDPAYIKNKPSIPAAQVNSDWNASYGVAEILNKPSIPSATSDLTNDSGFITASDVPGAQEQADWNEADSNDPAYIKNKPSIPAAQVNSDWNASSGVAEILNKPSIPTATSDLNNDSGFITASDVPAAQEQADWNEADSNDPAYIKNKPTIPPAQVNSDWNASSGVAEILNKPSIPSKTSDLQNDSGFITSSDIPAQVQSDWTESDSTDPAYIQHKPSIPSKTSDLTNDSGFITSSDIPAQVQSDWTESDNTDPAYIKNKPSIPAAQVNSDWNASSGVAEILNKPTIRNVPDVGSTDDGKVLKATYNGGNGSYAWDTAPSGVPSGGSNGQVLTQTANGPSWENVPTELPSGGTTGQVLTVTNNGVAWTNSNSPDVEYVNLVDLSTRFTGTTAILNEMATGKKFFFYEGEYSGDPWNPELKTWQVFDNLVTSEGSQYIRCKIAIGNKYYHIGTPQSTNGRGGDFDTTYNLIIGNDVWGDSFGYRVLYTMADSKFTPGTWIDGKNPTAGDANEHLNYYVAKGHHPLNEIIAVREYYSQTSNVHHHMLANHSVLLYRCILEYTESSSTVLPGGDSTHWVLISLTDLNLGQIQKFTVTPESITNYPNLITLDEKYNNGVIFSTGDIENIRLHADINGYPTEIDSVVIQWTVRSVTTLPKIWKYYNSEYHQWTGLAASANPTSLTVGKTYQLSILNNCYSIVEFG